MSENDHELLTAFTDDRSEAAFRALVERHLPVVWSCARRITNGDHALAEDITQQVFADLALKARGIPAATPLGGWLHRHAFFTATKSIRTESRRRTRESHAATMSEISPHPQPGGDGDALWAQLAPHLDAELAALPADDRAALVLRFFEKRSHRAVAAELGVSEEAARKRIDRALEKLRRRLKAKGASLASAAALAALLPLSIVAPPAGLAASVSAAATTAVTVGIGAGTATGLGVTISTLVTKLGGPAVVAGAAAGLALVVGGWWWGQRRAGAPEPAGLSTTVVRPPPPLRVASSPVDSLPPLSATAFLVPDSLVAARLLAPHNELDEDALYELAAASAEKGDGTIIETRSLSVPARSDVQGLIESADSDSYPTEFEYDSGGKATPAAFASRQVGTILKISGSPRDADGKHHVRFDFEHHLAPPAKVRWSGNLADPEADHASVVHLPQFYPVKLAGQVSVAPGQSRLGGAVRIPSWVNAKRSGSAQRLLVFITLDPETNQ